MEKKQKTQVEPAAISLGKRLILIDGNAIIHRAYHALPPLSTKQGELVNAVYGFASTLLSVIEKFKPDYVAASFDLAEPTFRHEKFEGYKANRTKADDELYAQIPRVKEVVKAFNIPIYEKAGFEADDVIGTIAKQAKNNPPAGGIETIIVTGDMDALQLVDENTKVYTMRRGLSDAIIYDEEKVEERYGLKPDQLIDFKGLRGDPSDNIPGVKGIGEKTASDLLQKYKSVAGVYENIEKIKGTIKDRLQRDKANAILSKDLATIHRDVPVKLEFEKTKLHDFNREEIVKLFTELNFYSLVKRLPREGGIYPVKSAGGGPASQLFNGVADFKYIIADEKNVDGLILEFKDAREISIAAGNEGIAVSHKAGRAFFFPEKMLGKIKIFLENKKIKKVGHDLKSIFKELAEKNIDFGGIFFDIMLAQYVLNPGEKITLDKLVLSELEEEIDFEKKSKGQLSFVTNEEDSEASILLVCKKADYSLKLKQALEKNIEKISAQQKKAGRTSGTIETVFEEIEMPLVEILGKMELAGIEINTVIFEGISKKIETTLENLEKSIYSFAEKEFNINSPQQLADVLFNVLKLPTFEIKKGKTGYSTAADELAKLRGKHKIIEKIEEYRELFKLKTTYLDTLPTMIDKNSRIHTTFNQAVTATGRLSSADPNLQNIPIRTGLGQLLRTAFVAKGGYKLVSADYSQIDLRAVAHVSQDKKLIEAFQRGDDIHKLTAAEINKVTLSQVTETMRRNAKELNFGIIYGMGAFGFSRSAGISREEAQKFIDTYMDKFSNVAKYMKETRESARKNGYVETLFGRRRNIPEINSPNVQVANGAERMAINMPIQGLAADIMKLAMIAVSKNYASDQDVKMLLQIHDEIILEVKSEIADEVAKKVKELLENVIKLSVPLVADVKIGDNWGEI